MNAVLANDVEYAKKLIRTALWRRSATGEMDWFRRTGRSTTSTSTSSSAIPTK